MNVIYRGPSDLPSVLPLFPLPGALLLPRGQMPLNIFEPRYLAMVDHALANDRLIGMIQPAAGEEAGEVPSQPVPEDPPEGPVATVTTATFADRVLRSEVPVIVDFWAPWCQPCLQLAPVLERVVNSFAGRVILAKVDIEQHQDIAMMMGVLPGATIGPANPMLTCMALIRSKMPSRSNL